MPTSDDPWHQGEPHPRDLDAWERDLERAHPGATRRLPRLGDGLTQAVDFLETYAELVAVTYARTVFLGELLAEQIERDARGGSGEIDGPYYPGPPETAGFIGYTMATNVVGPVSDQRVEVTPTGEQARALWEIERVERRELARLIEKAAAMNVQLHAVDAMKSYGRTISAALQALVVELGLSLTSEPILRAAQRSALAARRVMGQDDGDPDTHVGPRLSPVERVEALREALSRAERDAGVLPAG